MWLSSKHADPEIDAAIARAERRRGKLERMSDVGMELVEQVDIHAAAATTAVNEYRVGNPARAFAAYMARAVGGTPPGPLTTDVAAPDLGLEPDDQVYGLAPDAAAPGVVSDNRGEIDLAVPRPARSPRGSPADGDALPRDPSDDYPAPPRSAPRLDDRWLDTTLNAPPR